MVVNYQCKTVTSVTVTAVTVTEVTVTEVTVTFKKNLNKNAILVGLLAVE